MLLLLLLFFPLLTFLCELNIGLPPPMVVLHMAGVVSQIVFLQRFDGQRDGDLLLPQVFADCPARTTRRSKCTHAT